MTDDDLPSMGLYLVAVVGLAGASIGMMYAYYRASVPEFSAAFVADPVDAVENDPLSLLLFVAAVALVLLLFLVIIAVGAKYAPEPRERQQK